MAIPDAVRDEKGDTWSRRWRALHSAWLSRRAPAARAVTLDHRKLFILPTRAGLAFALVIVLLWLLGTNYENNLVFALAFLLASLFVVLPLHTFANLSGIEIRLLEAGTAFAGDFATARLALARDRDRRGEHIQLGWPAGDPVTVQVPGEGAVEVEVALPVMERGRVRAPRLRIETRFPLGLFRCWSWIDLDVEFLVYPQPRPAGPLPLGAALAEGESEQKRRGGDDFAGLRQYQLGHSPRQVAWKQFAAGRGLHSKDYESGVDSRLWLEWDLLAGRDIETRLGNLCQWVLDADRQQLAYGLRLPGRAIEPGLGPSHRDRLLAALALFPVQGV
ncbi:DUF58 domain-containing protein [Microbulbifer yueqingensis]|uniref:Uncharacterized conserved protein, DUF58 family, contains vWF domain n=1 Tax=Microbulbifer yueqingensis TaxID=658219 RepID=A0A1G8V3L0_9GAMM|nr:DUF58 domain-containing protein [Microbulbifer yueqingensis]SDJ60623.1 Uncharacterized conserved protein, DUF58 family, contains vWF domain [Microbulbifer yueqingensis]